jgi:hypothetical protein
MGNIPSVNLSVLSGDFALNIYAELFGIAVTVFLIDRLLAWREERKWRTATEINLRRLVRVTRQRAWDSANEWACRSRRLDLLKAGRHRQ